MARAAPWDVAEIGGLHAVGARSVGLSNHWSLFVRPGPRESLETTPQANQRPDRLVISASHW